MAAKAKMTRGVVKPFRRLFAHELTDGGHIAVATYEEIRTRISGKAYRVNMAKLMPVTYIVVLLMVGLFASTLYLDAVDPVKLSP
jgi:hypothetical protein